MGNLLTAIKEVKMSDLKTTNDMIDDEIRKEVNGLDGLTFGSSDYAKAVEGIERLRGLNLKDSEIDVNYDLKERELKLKGQELEQKAKELELKEKELDLRSEELDNDIANKDRELDLKEKELEEARNHAKKQLYAGIGLGILGTLLPAAVHVGLSTLGFRFEETGTIGSQTMRNIQNNVNSYTKNMN